MKTFKFFSMLLLVGSLAFATKSYGQLTIKSDVIDSGGIAVESGSLKAIYTIGEVAVNESQSGSLAISEGFINPQLFATIGISDYDILNTIAVYPNPATDYIQLHFMDSNRYQVAVYSLDGKKMLSKTISNNEFYSLNIESLVSATYVLIIVDEKNKKFKSFKLIKK